jgi:porin
LKDNQKKKAGLFDLNLLKPWKDWKSGVADRTGLKFGGDYLAVGFAATNSLGENTSASGVARIFGGWDLVNRGAANTGSIEFKIEHRHGYTDILPVAFGGEVGFVGTPEPVFNNDHFRATTLYWKQVFAQDKAVLRVGFLDMKEYFDIYALASPWNGFHNLAFTIGSNTMVTLPDAAFGVMIGGYLTDHIYGALGIIDAGFQPLSMFKGFETFFGDFNTFKTAEIGFTGGGKRFLFDNAHIAVWQQDDSEISGVKSGWGININVSHVVGDHWLPFLRAAWAHEGGGLYDRAVSVGFGYQDNPGGNQVGVGINWGRPNSATFGVDLNEQWISEVYYRIQLTENLKISPNLQMVINPAVNSNKNVIAVFGLRAQVTF